MLRQMYAATRALLFRLDAETSHDLALAGLRAYGRLPGIPAPLPGTPRRLMGLEFANVVGLAAGLDKDARAVSGLARLGFGFIEVGTVTPRPQPGNPRPRLFRLPRAEALINRMGFNNLGAEAMARRLDRLRCHSTLDATRLGVNIGKNKDTPLEEAADDYVRGMEALAQYADYLALNLSSPNTPGLRTLQSEAALAPLLERVKEAQSRLAGRHGRYVPIALKVAPDLAAADLDIVAGALRRFEIDAVIATNTTISRPGVADDPLADEAGGLSGRPLGPLSRDAVAHLREQLEGQVPIIGVGGVMDAAGGRAMLESGADLLQIYTGFIYRGPALIRDLAEL
jgi:dihydroorotate dehydrogenase